MTEVGVNVLEGTGTMTSRPDVAVTPTSVIQIPPNTKHAFTASADVRAVQIYTPAGPEQRFKSRASHDRHPADPRRRHPRAALA